MALVIKISFEDQLQCNAFAMLFEDHKFIDLVNQRIKEKFEGQIQPLDTTPFVDLSNQYNQHEIIFE